MEIYLFIIIMHMLIYILYMLNILICTIQRLTVSQESSFSFFKLGFNSPGIFFAFSSTYVRISGSFISSIILVGFLLPSQKGPPKCYLCSNSLCFFKSSGSTFPANQFEKSTYSRL